MSSDLRPTLLTPRDLHDFHRDGYVVVRGAVADAQVRAARHAINADLGGRGVPPDELPAYRSASFCPELRETEALTDVFNRSVLPRVMDDLLGEGQTPPVGNAQIALRFPVPPPGGAAWRESGHLDGVGTGINGTPVGAFTRHFTCLAVVLLNDLPGPWHGNFTVWPGSHVTAEAFFREATPEVLRQGHPKYELPREPVQVTGRAGDAVITHHQLWHGAAPNYGPDVRYATIYRPAHRDVARNGTGVMTDIWREFAGVRTAVT